MAFRRTSPALLWTPETSTSIMSFLLTHMLSAFYSIYSRSCTRRHWNCTKPSLRSVCNKTLLVELWSSRCDWARFFLHHLRHFLRNGRDSWKVPPGSKRDGSTNVELVFDWELHSKYCGVSAIRWVKNAVQRRSIRVIRVLSASSHFFNLSWGKTEFLACAWRNISWSTLFEIIPRTR